MPKSSPSLSSDRQLSRIIIGKADIAHNCRDKISRPAAAKWPTWRNTISCEPILSSLERFWRVENNLSCRIVYTSLGFSQSSPIMMAIKCTHGYHVASLIKLRMLISITAPPTKLTSVLCFPYHSESYDLQVSWGRIGAQAAVHVARRRGENFGRELKGFTKF